MGDWRDFPLPDGSYSDETRPWTQQDVCNYLPTFAEGPGTRSRVKYATAPGQRTWAVVGDGPHRGARDVEGKRFVVSGNKLYQVATTGIATLLGTIPGTRRVSMTHNQIAGGNELVIATGDNSYVWNTVAGTLTATGVPLLFVDFINQMIVGIDVARRFWRYSGLADATSWNALDNESAESSPDRLVGLLVSQGEVLLFGERTIEVWSNSPTDNTSFQRSTVIEKGCANGNTCCRLDNTVYFVGNDSIPYRLQGYTPVPIASKAITEVVSGGDPDKLFAFTWEDRGYVVYYLTAQDGNTWGYDVTCQKWHRRESFGLSRWRINTLVKWGGSWYAGDYSSGKMYLLEWGLVYEGADIFPRSIRTGVMHSDGNRISIHALRLFAATGGDSGNLDPLIELALAGDLTDSYVGATVTGAYTASGGVPPYTYAVTSGTFPAGLTLATGGTYSGEPTTADDYTWTVTATDADGNTVALADSATIAGLACGAEQDYEGGQSFPTQITVLLGAGIGDVTLDYLTGTNPDRFVVTYDGVDVIDTGYVGDSSFQAALDADLAGRGLPPSTIVQYTTPTDGTGLDTDPGTMHAVFAKTTATPTTATLKIYGPLSGTQWQARLGCPV